MATPSRSESDPGAPPPLELQKEFWDRWNREFRQSEVDDYMARQRETAVAVAARTGLREARILDVGCGTGWLGNALLPFGRVWGADLSADAIARGRMLHPEVTLASGDFLEVELPPVFDFVVCADALAHMRDQAACIDRIARLLRPGGTLLLMTQNAFVWRRRSRSKSLGRGQHQVWPSAARYRALLAPHFETIDVTSFDPGGDMGVLWWVENRYVRGGMGRLVGRQRWRRLLERMHLGRERVYVARRRSSAL